MLLRMNVKILKMNTKEGLTKARVFLLDLLKLLFCLTALVVAIATLLDYYKDNPSLSLYNLNSQHRPTDFKKAKGFQPEHIESRKDNLIVATKTEDNLFTGFFLPSTYLPDIFEPALERVETKSTKSFSITDSSHEESLLSYRKAIELYKNSPSNKLIKKLLQHALALDDKYVDALNLYGEILESENILQADMYYQRAVECQPTHTTALDNRKRTGPLVKKIDQKMLSEIDHKKKELYKYSPTNPELNRAMKEFYYHHIYHTVALEGSSLTIEEIRAIIDSRMPVLGKTIVEHNEAIGIDEALKYLNTTLAIKLGDLTVDFIKEIHRRVMGFNDPVNAAQFRSSQVFVGKHIPPHPNLVPQYMKEFMEWINSYEAMQLHPVEFAAIAHYKLVFIHPFLDGNGRTSRLLMNFILMKYGFPPVSIQIQDRFIYYETLQAGNHGDLRPFIRFIAKCTSTTLDDYLNAAKQHTFNYPELGDDHIIGR